MQYTDYISNDITPLTLNHTIEAAKTIFTDVLLTHIPIVDDGGFVGLISRDDFIDFDDSKSIRDIQFSLQQFYTIEAIDFLILRLFSLHETNIIPVLDKQKKYIGYYELVDILALFSQIPFLSESGDVIVVSKNQMDYSISEITQIVESNGATIHGIFMSNKTRSDVEVTIKLYSNNLNDVIHTFRRYDYQIILGVSEDEYLSDLKNKSDYFKKYLSI